MNDWLNANTLFASLLWGSIGLGLFIYGKKQGAMIPLIGGIVLMLVSYLIGNWLWMSLASVGLLAAVWLLSKQYG
jgi:hypothetical protein